MKIENFGCHLQGLSADLIQEIEYQLEVLQESEENHLPADPQQGLYLILRDIEDLILNKSIRGGNWLVQIQRWMIERGVYRIISEREIANTVTTHGKAYDFKFEGKKYVFEKHLARWSDDDDDEDDDEGE